MPLLNIDMLRGKTPAENKKVLDAIHAAVVEAFEVPERDRYQILNLHDQAEMILLDTGLGFDRTENQLVIRVTSKKRTEKQKQLFYKRVTERLLDECQIEPRDVMISIVENGDADWSFGYGEAQFLNGKL
ncbi:tautomerase family protein [Listeria valentina]|uniref:tautomerase family protein n=1 Tax=Listeria valentina TaxID=2705293 RepID=UPI001430C758|nr:tautomerase family protein [Listeria valentina]